MKFFIVSILVLMLSSCENFKVKKTSSEAILKEELQTFNWNDVDEYPSFENCESSISKAEKKVCFQHTLTNHITGFLMNERIVVSQDIYDTVLLQMQVSKRGMLKLIGAKIDSLTIQEIPELDSIIKNSLDSLPKIFPAIKRGQQVTTEFSLPLVISVE
ncbi:hypothetical protein [Tamlana crocina]|uniref:TonB C-terminal domain-containing protein n=1 Tax=Tamlana crocina TaxID=393006 RepID=A0ABX1DCR7_9FLAO|nr:hypothetical protein [Tamlana crocina]NJX15867.1 hypothetical protein [Tamlana crocina]